MMTARPAIMLAAFAAVSGVVSPTSGESLPFSDLADVRGPYDGVGAEGEALYVCTLGNADGWPICAYWSSARTERSPLFGYGWCIPALESRFYSIDERRWAFHQPDGYVRIFVRAERGKSNVLFGGSAWTATLDGDSARIVAGMGEPESWIVLDDDVTGLEPGRALREFIAASGGTGRAVGVAASLRDVPESAVRLTLCGRSAAAGPAALSRLPSLREARVLSPPNPAEWLSANVRGISARVYCGEFSPDCPEDERPGLTIVPGAAEHLPRWVGYAFNWD